jgi:hypothetical protein
MTSASFSTPAAAGREVRIFLCADRQEMCEERESLLRGVLRRLNERYREHGVRFVVENHPGDGVPTKEPTFAELSQRFEQIDACDLFIALLGEQTGRVVTGLPDEFLRTHAWLEAHRGATDLELEIQYAVLGRADKRSRALFYRRVGGAPPSRSVPPRIDSRKQADRVSRLERGLAGFDLPVAEYSATWEATAQSAAGLDAFCDTVFQDVCRLVDRQGLLGSEAASGHRARAAEGASPQSAPDENVRFTVYRPKTVRPRKWYPMVAFVHLDELPAEASEGDPDPRNEVEGQADRLLGPAAGEFDRNTVDSRHAIPREGELTFLPEMDGIDFNPPLQSIRWMENVHRVEFRLRARPALDQGTARGRLVVFLGPFLLADVPLTIRVDGSYVESVDSQDWEPAVAPAYRKVFASYSHQDEAVVTQVESHVESIGDRYLRDCRNLRSGEPYDERLLEMIEEADVFQLFWSTNSMRSDYVRREWEHAISLRPKKGRYFIRPIYWEDPFPEDTANGLPPDSLRRLHFSRLKTVPPSPPATPVGQPFDAAPLSEAMAQLGAPAEELDSAIIVPYTELALDVQELAQAAQLPNSAEAILQVVDRFGMQILRAGPPPHELTVSRPFPATLLEASPSHFSWQGEPSCCYEVQLRTSQQEVRFSVDGPGCAWPDDLPPAQPGDRVYWNVASAEPGATPTPVVRGWFQRLDQEASIQWLEIRDRVATRFSAPLRWATLARNAVELGLLDAAVDFLRRAERAAVTRGWEIEVRFAAWKTLCTMFDRLVAWAQGAEAHAVAKWANDSLLEAVCGLLGHEAIRREARCFECHACGLVPSACTEPENSMRLSVCSAWRSWSFATSPVAGKGVPE